MKILAQFFGDWTKIVEIGLADSMSKYQVKNIVGNCVTAGKNSCCNAAF